MKRALIITAIILVATTLSASTSLTADDPLSLYDFTNSIDNTAYVGTISEQPPVTLEIGDPFPYSNENGSGTYTNISSSDNVRAWFGPYEGYSDYHRFQFKILDPVDTILKIYVEHEGFGSHWNLSEPQGLTLFIWDYEAASWVYLDHHNSHYDDIVKATIVSDVAHVIDSEGYLNLLVQTKENIGSCPFLFTYDGEEYVFVADLYGNSIIDDPEGYVEPIPEDYVAIKGEELKPDQGVYRVQVTQEYDEITYLDHLYLMTVDHPPGVDVFPSLRKHDPSPLYTVSEELATPLSAVNDKGVDGLESLAALDDWYAVGSAWELDLGDLSGADHIQLVISAYTKWIPGSSDDEEEPYERFVQVQDEGGKWVTVYDYTDLIVPAALPRTYVLDLTDQFINDIYRVRIEYANDVRFDYIGVDVSPPRELAVTTCPPIETDLHFRGYSALTGLPATPIYDEVSPLPPSRFSQPCGNFTRFGDVTPLLMERDDKFVIMHHGDEISLSFPHLPVPEGLERDFALYAWGQYKNRYYGTGGTVDPLPFYGMSSYPYPSNETYPYDMEHTTYLTEYNTRQYDTTPDQEAPTHNSIYTDYVKIEVYLKPVGGEVTLINRLQLLLPWIAFGLITIVTARWILTRRRPRRPHLFFLPQARMHVRRIPHHG